MKLFPYQVEGAKFLASRRRALLLDAPGLGKTAQAIAAADQRESHLETICPASVVTQWRKMHGEISTGNSGFTSRSYESARDKGISAYPGILALDEMHYLKNRTSGRTARILGSEIYGSDGLISRADSVWGLSGTPSPKDPSDLFPVVNAIIPGSLSLKNGNTMSYWQFMKRFCKMYDNGYGMVVASGQNLDELKDRLAPYVLRRTKKDVMADWKEPLVTELWLNAGEAGKLLSAEELEPEAQAIAEAFKRGGYEALKNLSDLDNSGVSKYRRYVGILKVIPTLNWLMDELSDENKIVVIAVHREVIEGLSAKLNEHKIGNTIYYGGMTATEKDEAIKAFVEQPEIRVFIGQIVSAGTGVDGLQHATGRMVFLEYSWVADDNLQCIGRLDRIGQKEPVLAQFIGLEGSLDGDIAAKAARRARENKDLWN